MKSEKEIKEVLENFYKMINAPKPVFVKDFRPRKRAQAEILEWVLED